jgi:hypothetical protein
MVSVAGWIIRVTTVRWEQVRPEHKLRDRRPQEQIVRTVRVTGPGVLDAMAIRPLELPAARALSGPCGTKAQAGKSSAWQQLLVDLAHYIERWGHAPLGDGRIERQPHRLFVDKAEV